jgi:HD-GYP domain-containing protein (c-di-GMP phosphodiesterase class II)
MNSHRQSRWLNDELDESIGHSTKELSLEQFSALKRHPLEGERLLMDLGGMGGVSLDIVRHHHEKLNGKGYPDGLKGEQISPIVRVVTITYIFDALTTNRPDRKGLTTFEALKLMAGNMGSELDLVLLRKFIEMMGTRS